MLIELTLAYNQFLFKRQQVIYLKNKVRQIRFYSFYAVNFKIL